MEESKFFVKQFRAQNNFRAVAGHDDRPKKFLIGSSLVSDRSKYRGGGGGSQLILVSFSFVNMIAFAERDKNVRFKGKDLAVCSRMRVWRTSQHDRRVKF